MNNREGLRVAGKVLNNSVEAICGSAAMAFALILFMDWCDLSSDPVTNTVVGASGLFVTGRAVNPLAKALAESDRPKTDD